MDKQLLKKVFGSTPGWQGPCTILVKAETSVKTNGHDSILAGGTKSYAPRTVSGRVCADVIYYQSEFNALLAIQRVPVKKHTGEDLINQTLLILNTDDIVGVEFEGLDQLANLGITPPPLPDRPLYAPSTLVG